MICSTEKYEKTKIYVEKTTFMPHINHMTTPDAPLDNKRSIPMVVGANR